MTFNGIQTSNTMCRERLIAQIFNNIVNPVPLEPFLSKDDDPETSIGFLIIETMHLFMLT